MASLFTNKNQEILVDEEDVEFLSKFSWSLVDGYPQARIRRELESLTFFRGKVLMSRLLLSLESQNFQADHKNGNKLDNRRKNLQILTPLQNHRKKHLKQNSGVEERNGKFRSFINLTIDGYTKRFHLGTFETFDLALMARIIGEIRHWGEPVQRLP